MQENIPEDNSSQNIEVLLEELFEKLFEKFTNPQDIVTEILRCTEGQPEQAEFIVQQILESEYPNDDNSETQWIDKLVQGGLIQQWVETNAEIPSSSDNEQESGDRELQQVEKENNIQTKQVNDIRDTSRQTKILSGIGITIFCVITFFLWPKNQNQNNQYESNSDIPLETTQCFRAHESFVNEALVPAIDDPTDSQIERIEEWLNEERKTVEITCLNKFYENYLNDIFHRYANKLIDDRKQYRQSIDYMCQITETHSEFTQVRNRLRDWQTKGEPISAYKRINNIDSSSCPALRDLNEID